MRSALTVTTGLLLVLTGCGSSSLVLAGDPPREPYTGPMRLPVASEDDASVLERSGAAGRALECAAEPYAGGSGEYDGGLASAQRTPREALENYFTEEFLPELPRADYRVEREDEGRVLFSFDVRGRTKVAFIVADSVRDFNEEEGWGVETWAQCDPAEFPASVTDAFDTQVWQDASGNRVPIAKIWSSQGPEHCGWEDITFLTLTTPDGEREYLRDTTGELRDSLATTFDPSATVPDGAIDTGYEQGGRHLWLHPDGSAAYLVDKTDPENVERWPAAKENIACD